MLNHEPPTPANAPPVAALVQYVGQADHFVGVDAALAASSVRAIRINEWEFSDLDLAPVGLIAVKDCESPLAVAALRWARRRGVPSLLLMDGVVEYRNTFVNPDAPECYLRPVPVDVVACAGEIDRARLWSWGNVAIATGLPRIAAAFQKSLPSFSLDSGKLLIATARRPAFDATERSRLLAALRDVRGAAQEAGWGDRLAWRLTAGLSDELGVRNDSRPLRECLAECLAVLTTPSTLLLEAMAAGRACGILHPQDGPLWQEAMGEWRGADVSPRRDLLDLLHRLAAPDEADLRRQRRAMERMHAWGERPEEQPAAKVAAAIVSLLRGELRGGPGRKRELPRVAQVRLGHGADASESPVKRVVSCVTCDSTPIGGVMTWSLRMSREFAARRPELGYEFRTLVVAMQPEGWKSDEFDPTLEPGVDLCVVNPMADHHERVETIRNALESLRPDIVLPNYNDACFMAAALLKPRGVRTVAIAHADDAYYRELARTYDTWSAAVGVSAACMEWLSPMAAERSAEQIVYGVPAAQELWQRQAPPPRGGREWHEPVKLAYIGRMVEEQKRIGDLLVLIDELEARGVACELHMVGDGPDLAAWRSRLAQRACERVRVVIHGRRSPAWVERFLPTMDACVLVSEYEGTSVVMLEAMGQGVAPVVTDVRSGVREWVRDGENGIVVPIGDMRRMAARIAAIATERASLDAMKQRAWETIIQSGLSIPSTAAAYARVFDAAIRLPIDPRPTDTGLRPIDQWRWGKGCAAEDAAGADAWCEKMLREAGYRAIAFDGPTIGCDAVLVRSTRIEPVSAAEVAAWREQGLGVAVSPHLRQDGLAAQVLEVVRGVVARGARRIAVYPAGRHTRRVAESFRAQLWEAGSGSPLVGFIDDGARPGQTAMGLPVVRPEQAIEQLVPDTVLLSTDAFEDALWERTAFLRERGIEVLRIYGEPRGTSLSRSEVRIKAAASVPREAHGEAHAHRAG